MPEHLMTLDDDPRDFIVWRQGSGRSVEIFDIQIGSERRIGRGTKLVDKLLNSLRKGTTGGGVTTVYAITRHGNTIACQFYEKLGFRLCGRLHYFYTDEPGQHEHALVYAMDI